MVRGFRGGVILLFLLVLADPGPRSAAAQCIGDCSGEGVVTTAEVKLGVQIDLLELPPSACAGFTAPVEVDQLVSAVINSLGSGCQPTQTPVDTATPTVTPTVTTTPTVTSTLAPSNTPGGIPNAVAGGAAVVAKSLGGIPSLVTAIVTGIVRGGSTAAVFEADQGGGAGACPEGGTATRTCTTPAGGGAELSISLASCVVSVADGTLTFNTPTGPIILTSGIPASCAAGGVFPGVPINASADVSNIVRNGAAEILLNSRATLTAVVVPQIPIPTTTCRLTGARLTLTGSLSSATPSGRGAVLSFAQTVVDFAITTYNEDCVPIQYSLTFNGPATVTETNPPLPSDLAEITFSNFIVTVNASSSPTLIQMDGGLSFDCVQGAIVFDTVTPLAAIPGQICPNAGRIQITSPEGPSVIEYLAGGAVRIDVNNDGVFDNMFDSCVDPGLGLCPQP